MPGQADAFVDSIGVNSHFDFTGTPYDTNYATVSALLVASGIRHIRDGGTSAAARYANLYSRGGITAAIYAPHTSTDADIANAISLIPSAYFIEPDNEYNATHGRWAATLQTYQPHLYAGAKGDARFHGVVLGPSMYQGTGGAASLGDLSAYLDAGNVHAYPGNQIPEDGGAFLSTEINWEKQISGSKPIWLTETGYGDNLSGSNNYPDSVLMKYIPRLFAEAWNLGVAHTFIYQLSNMTAADSYFGNYGLIDDAGNPKPQYYAIKSMIALLTDPGTASAPSAYTWSFSGSTGNVNHVTLRKRDGSTWILLWIAKSDYNASPANTYNTVTPQSVTIKPAALPSSATAYTYNTNGTTTSAALMLSNGAVTLNATDTITFLKLAP